MGRRSTSKSHCEELADVKRQNEKLQDEIRWLSHKLSGTSIDQQNYMEVKLRMVELEKERDHAVQTLWSHKKKYKTLHDAYLKKEKRCQTLEEIFKRQKTLTGLVKKPADVQNGRNSELQIPQSTSNIWEVESEDESGEWDFDLETVTDFILDLFD